MTTRAEYLRETDPTFVDDLLRSVEHVETVAAWLRRRGFEVEVPATKIRPAEEQRLDYSDDGDLRIRFAGEWRRGEVKQRRFDFDLSGFPFPTVFLGEVHKWDRAEPKPTVYFVTNRLSTVALVIYVERTFHEWTVSEKWDSSKGRLCRSFECPAELGTLRSMT